MKIETFQSIVAAIELGEVPPGALEAVKQSIFNRMNNNDPETAGLWAFMYMLMIFTKDHRDLVEEIKEALSPLVVAMLIQLGENIGVSPKEDEQVH